MESLFGLLKVITRLSLPDNFFAKGELEQEANNADIKKKKKGLINFIAVR